MKTTAMRCLSLLAQGQHILRWNLMSGVKLKKGKMHVFFSQAIMDQKWEKESDRDYPFTGMIIWNLLMLEVEKRAMTQKLALTNGPRWVAFPEGDEMPAKAPASLLSALGGNGVWSLREGRVCVKVQQTKLISCSMRKGAPEHSGAPLSCVMRSCLGTAVTALGPGSLIIHYLVLHRKSLPTPPLYHIVQSKWGVVILGKKGLMGPGGPRPW